MMNVTDAGRRLVWKPRDLTVLRDLEAGPLRLGFEESLEGCQPDIDSAFDRKTLRNPGDDDLPPGDRQVLELPVLGQEHRIPLCESLDDLSIRDPAKPESDQVLAVNPLTLERAVQSKREVLVEEEPQDTSRTAGGTWPARCAAYRSAART